MKCAIAAHVPSDRTRLFLTDKQADFINNLHHSNVPAAGIARMMEWTLTDPHAVIRQWERDEAGADEHDNDCTAELPC